MDETVQDSLWFMFDWQRQDIGQVCEVILTETQQQTEAYWTVIEKIVITKIVKQKINNYSCNWSLLETKTSLITDNAEPSTTIYSCWLQLQS